jgi:hypothetical protein
MIFESIPPFSGIISLVMVIGYTIDGVARTLLLVPISIDMKPRGLYLKSRKTI